MTPTSTPISRITRKAPVIASAIASMLLVAAAAQAPWTTAGLTGGQASPGLVQVALAGAAAGAFVAFSDGVFRLVGGLLIASAGLACALLSTRVGISAQAAGVWPWVSVALSTIAAASGFAVLALSRHWGRSSRRYVADAKQSRRDSVSDWDRLTHGDDPTL